MSTRPEGFPRNAWWRLSRSARSNFRPSAFAFLWWQHGAPFREMNSRQRERYQAAAIRAWKTIQGAGITGSEVPS